MKSGGISIGKGRCGSTASVLPVSCVCVPYPEQALCCLLQNALVAWIGQLFYEESSFNSVRGFTDNAVGGQLTELTWKYGEISWVFGSQGCLPHSIQCLFASVGFEVFKNWISVLSIDTHFIGIYVYPSRKSYLFHVWLSLLTVYLVFYCLREL